MSSKNIFSLDGNKNPDYLTQVVIEHLLADTKAKTAFQQFIRRYWSQAERTDSLRKFFLTEVMQYLLEDRGQYPLVTKAILTDWAQYTAYTIIEWTDIYVALETDQPLLPHCNDLSRAIYRSTSQHNWHKYIDGATTNEQGGEMLRNGILLTCLIWLEHAEYKNFAIKGASVQIAFHALTYSVNWEKVAKFLDEEDSPK